MTRLKVLKITSFVESEGEFHVGVIPYSNKNDPHFRLGPATETHEKESCSHRQGAE